MNDKDLSKILVQYIYPDSLPDKGYKRMQYFTSFSNEPDKFYYGLSIRKSYDKTQLDNWARENKLIKLPEPVHLPYRMDLFLSFDGWVVKVDGVRLNNDSLEKIVNLKN